MFSVPLMEVIAAVTAIAIEAFVVPLPLGVTVMPVGTFAIVPIVTATGVAPLYAAIPQLIVVGITCSVSPAKI